MTREEILKSEMLLKRFCRDAKMPITVYKEPYFMERLKALDTFYGGMKAFDDFCETVCKYETPEEYISYYNSVKDKAVTHIKEHPSYEKMNDIRVYQTMKQYPGKNVFTDINVGKKFISVDIRKANFSIMNMYLPELFFYEKSWEDFLAHFTDSKFIINSKYIRQVVLGACNCKKQAALEKDFTRTLYEVIEGMVEVPASLYNLSNDELVFENATEELYEALNAIVRKIMCDSIVRVDMYRLLKAEEGYIRENVHTGKIEFKCVSGENIHQVVKKYMGEPITDNDLVFSYNGKLARYLEPI